ncbi:filamin-A-interacting protein 1-like isoform X2 [Alosa sapidissima]|uniref:filamin-A-interacting protein 1-like isoform X2 n=1 Tax=Alosa sapidissima TaxID=34773 RepID=UPI001C096F9E|nr:filamin-A-interacting protein 1-like isoform X2 [Alosa sapidissima]
MRSRSSAMEIPDRGQLEIAQPARKAFQKDEDGGKGNAPEPTKRNVNEIKEDRAVPGTAKRTQKGPERGSSGGKRKVALADLSKEDLVRLLGVMEGEVQAREDIIQMMKSERTRPEVLEAHYGSAAPAKPLQALQRDALMTNSKTPADDVYEVPMAELDRLESKQRETYRRMLEQLLLAEKCHRRTVNDLDSEKRKHTDFINKSDDFTNLLEQERERLKRLLEQEKSYQLRKEKEHSKRLEKVRQELVKLKSFALMLVDERQLHIEQIDLQSHKVQDLTKKLQERDQQLETVSSQSKEGQQKVLQLEAELENRTTKVTQEHEEMTSKLSYHESESRQLRLKLATLSRRIEELEESNGALQKSEADLQELRERISRGECGNSSLMAELENLRKKVLEMEGKDEEITKTEMQCKELKKKLQDEESYSKELRLEVEKLQKRMVELERLEVAFNKSKADCAQLHTNLEREKNLAKDLASELETVKSRVKELENSESKFEKAEVSLKEDLSKLKSFTVILVDERKNMSERIQQEEQKSDDLSKMFKTEQSKVMEVTEKLIEESKKLLKLKSEMEFKVSTLTKEKEDLQTKLAREEEKCKDLASKVNQMKKRMNGFEEAGRESSKSMAGVDKLRISEEDNKVKELTLEIERLKKRLKQLEVVEGDLMKTEDEYELLEKKFRTEQDKANALSRQLDEMRSQIARNKAIEKGEMVSQETELRMRCKMEEAKTRDLQADVQALKEKIHELMNKEDQLSQLQVDYAILQQRLMEEEARKRSMSEEVSNLTKELEVTKCYSRVTRPSMNGKRIVDVPVTSTAVQTDVAAGGLVEEENPAVFIRKSVLEENHIMSNLRQRGLKKPAVLERYPPAAAELNMRKSWIPWMKKKEPITVAQTTPERTVPQVNGETTPEPITMSQKPGQPLHIRVTPNHQNSTATLEITSPRAEDFFSSTTIIPTLGLQKPRITIVPKPTTVTPKMKTGEGACGPERAKSPVTITTISRAKGPEAGKGTDSNKPLSPVSIITVSTSPLAEAIGVASQEPRDVTGGRTVYKVTPEKQSASSTIRKCSSNTNIITTEDNKIHIHLGPQFKRPQDSGSSGSSSGSSPMMTIRPLSMAAESKEAAMGTVLRSPRQNAATTTPGKATASKVTSSITITPVTSSPARPTQSVVSDTKLPLNITISPVTSSPARPTQSVLLLKCFKMISDGVCSLDSSLSSPGRMDSQRGPQPHESLCQKKLMCTT